MDASRRLPLARRARFAATVGTFVTAWADFADQDESADLHPVEASGDEESFVTPWSGFEDVTINITGPDALLVDLDDSPDDGPHHELGLTAEST